MKHLYSLNAGELLVGDQLEAHGWTVYVPAKDIGIDLLAERDGRIVRLQVKESRTYENQNAYMGWHSWSQLNPDDLNRAVKQLVDAFVFVVHAPDERGHRKTFDVFYVIVEPRELEKRLDMYRSSPDRAVAWYREGTKLWEVRGMTTQSAGIGFKCRERDFSPCLNNWDLYPHGPDSGSKRNRRTTKREVGS